MIFNQSFSENQLCIDAPPLLDGTLAGDLGFDPLGDIFLQYRSFRLASLEILLGIVKSEKELFAIREAEMKHGRIALLAAVGWPISELYHYTLAKSLGMEDLLAPVRVLIQTILFSIRSLHNDRVNVLQVY